MTRHIDCYFDVASMFSYIAFKDLRSNADLLAAHGVTVEFHPTLLAGINNLTGNKPPWLLPIKGAWISEDTKRAAARVGLSGLKTPDDFMSISLTTSPLRALHYIKANYPVETFHAAVEQAFDSLWRPPHVNYKKEEDLVAVLRSVAGPDGRRLFSDDEVRRIVDGRAAMKDKLTAVTQQAVDLGAFGAPWLWVTNPKGESKGFFGSDRFNHVYKHLEIPFQDIAILPPSKL